MRNFPKALLLLRWKKKKINPSWSRPPPSVVNSTRGYAAP